MNLILTHDSKYFGIGQALPWTEGGIKSPLNLRASYLFSSRVEWASERRGENLFARENYPDRKRGQGGREPRRELLVESIGAGSECS